MEGNETKRKSNFLLFSGINLSYCLSGSKTEGYSLSSFVDEVGSLISGQNFSSLERSWVSRSGEITTFSFTSLVKLLLTVTFDSVCFEQSDCYVMTFLHLSLCYPAFVDFYWFCMWNLEVGSNSKRQLNFGMLFDSFNRAGTCFLFNCPIKNIFLAQSFGGHWFETWVKRMLLPCNFVFLAWEL